ncbi:PQQ-dependent sugar dehydrogenase [Ruegeria marina]|uniref:Glucose/arabinose dehydrogenase, beta-propeller fold n=1 Tax=Ruegeria marina TaxID=639004 RepID=A0A1G6IJ32_9RHOB|nr:PQQ-dependent sugar dehydrogenase [Ruegeria marina]SDC06461.1 Glucose/arabinose dehydrogenase, beta-propeller fold [Ruegeria marina]
MLYRLFNALILTLCFIGSPGMAQSVLTTSAGQVRLEVMAEGLDTPWAVAPLPEGGALITERGGRLVFASDGRVQPVTGVPRTRSQGQGGLLDITLAADFAQSRELFLTYSRPQSGGGAGTAVAVARLSPENRRLTQVNTIFEAAPGSKGGRHFGSRVVEATDGTLFVTLGDRGEAASAQDRSNHNGSVIRIRRDGSVPADNPFVGNSGVRPEIWSWGHRNPQGAALDGRGRLWTSEHGARGGDEINLIRKGANYGWPVISYGTEYSGARIGEGTHKAGMEQPSFYWDPSIAPSGLMIYSGRLWPEWQGHLFVGSLKFDHIARLAGEPPRQAERIEGPETERLRDIVEAPDGTIWFISEGRGAVYRMSPAS